MPPLCVALWLSCAASLAFAVEIYRWVDGNGVTHYASSPPPGVKASGVPLAPAPPAAAVSQAQAQARKLSTEAERLAAERARSLDQRQLQQGLRRAAVPSRLQRCATARQQLAVAEKGGPVFRLDAQGQRVPLPDNQRDGEIARLRADVAANCDAGDAEQEAATRQRIQEGERASSCLAARDRVRELEDPALRAADSDVQQARERMQKLCGATP